jgi:hypothetical protein
MAIRSRVRTLSTANAYRSIEMTAKRRDRFRVRRPTLWSRWDGVKFIPGIWRSGFPWAELIAREGFKVYEKSR